jgi:hypothetical protein
LVCPGYFIFPVLSISGEHSAIRPTRGGTRWETSNPIKVPSLHNKNPLWFHRYTVTPNSKTCVVF